MKSIKNQKESSVQLKNPQQSKIKQLLLKKLEREENPELIIEGLENDIAYKLEKMDEQISKQMKRLDKVKKVQEADLKARDSLKQRLDQKMVKNLQKKQRQQKAKFQAKQKQRKIHQQLISMRKRQIKEAQMRKRLQQFKQYQSLNQKQRVIIKTNHIQKKDSQKINRYSSQEHIRRSKQLDEYQYYKAMQLLNKKKVFQKPQKSIKKPNIIDKSEHIQKIKEAQAEIKFKMYVEDLQNIQQARKKKEKQIKALSESKKKKQDLSQQLRSYRIQSLKQETMKKLIELKEKEKKKNEKFVSHKSLLSNTLGSRKNQSSKDLRPNQNFRRTVSSFREKIDITYNLTDEETRKRDIKQKLRKQIQQYVRIKKHSLLNMMH